METEPVPWSWEEALKKESEAAGVGVINHAPLSEFWPKLQMVGAVAEVRTDQVRALAENNNSERPDDLIPTFYNVEVIQVAGYYAKVRFLGYSEDHEAGENLIWIHSKNLKEICAHKKQGVVGIPPWAIAPDSSVEVLSRLFNAMIGKFSVNPLIEILVENSLKSPTQARSQGGGKGAIAPPHSK
ncbi:unnamed protein product [Allacma fusca]|uniref:Uncharacterized protein n=1 Tax=Allacma fusca TaxID=39272 RepID=A0A8J2LFZ9_9HEXA|nr:unnamed protein product [Allacma fusca]